MLAVAAARAFAESLLEWGGTRGAVGTLPTVAEVLEDARYAV